MQDAGWFKDPYERHDARWFSNGAPTSLVRDGLETSTDLPPPRRYQGPLVPVEPSERTEVPDRREPGFFRRAVESIIDVVPW